MHFLICFCSKIIFDKKNLFAEINLTTRGPLYTCLVYFAIGLDLSVFGHFRPGYCPIYPRLIHAVFECWHFISWNFRKKSILCLNIPIPLKSPIFRLYEVLSILKLKDYLKTFNWFRRHEATLFFKSFKSVMVGYFGLQF